RSVAFSPDGRYVAAAREHALAVWHADTGTPHGVVAGLPKAARPTLQANFDGPLGFSPDGELLAVMLEDSRVHMWRMHDVRPTGVVIQTGDHEIVVARFCANDRVTTAWFDHDARGVRMWDANSGLALSDDRPIDCWFIPMLADDGRTIFGYTDGVAKGAICDEAGERVLWSIDPGAGFTARMVGELVDVRCGDGRVDIHDRRSGARIGSFPATGSHLDSAAIAEDGAAIAVAEHDQIAIVDIPSCVRRAATIQQRTKPAHMRFAGGAGNRLLAAGNDTVRAWDTITGSQVGPTIRHRAHVTALWTHPTSADVVAVMSSDGVARLWTVGGAEPEPRWRVPAPGRGHAMAGAEDTVAVLTPTQGVTLHSIETGAASAAGRLPVVERAHTMTVSPDGALLAVVSHTGAIQVWRAVTGEMLWDHVDETDWNTVVVFSPDGRTLAVGGATPGQAYRGRVDVYDAVTGSRIEPSLRPMFTVGDRAACAFSADGRHIATGIHAGGIVQLWDAENGDELATVTRHSVHVTAVAFGPGDRLLASSSVDGTVQLWDAAARQIACAPLPHRAPVTCLAFHPDGDVLATGSGDGSVRFWDVRTAAAVGEPIQHDGRVESIQYVQDGRALLTACEGSVQLWDLPIAPDTLDEMRRHTWIALG
ncbi:MAG: hypothetical protein ABGY41_12280, partial [Candidatus Poribacteria bacterium]